MVSAPPVCQQLKATPVRPPREGPARTATRAEARKADPLDDDLRKLASGIARAVPSHACVFILCVAIRGRRRLEWNPMLGVLRALRRFLAWGSSAAPSPLGPCPPPRSCNRVPDTNLMLRRLCFAGRHRYVRH